MSHPSSARILHIIESTTAGVRRYVTYLLQHQSPRWHMEVACPIIRQANYGDVAFVEEIRQMGIPIHDVPMRRAIGPSDALALRELRSVVQRGRFDLIHTHSSKAGFLGRLTARLSGIPAVHTPNGLYYLGQHGPKRQFYRSLEQLAGSLTTAMIAVSAGECEVIRRDRLVKPERLCIIKNGVDAQQIRDQADSPEGRALRDRLKLNGQHPIIGAAGRMVPQKDPLTFVRAAARLREVLPDATFVWCGDGELRAETERLAAQLNVPLMVPGHQENSAAIMRAFDVFVLPSIYEGLPFALLEAMALALPIVATDIIGIHDVLGQELAGWVTAPQDADALAAAIAQAWAQPEESWRRAQTARHMVEDHFSVEHMVQQHLALYEQILQKKASRRI
jgi:glycosyltransferase involved in cell wall biosynthesis